MSPTSSLTAVDLALIRSCTLRIASSGRTKGSSRQSRRCTRSSAVASPAKHSCANSGTFSSISIGNKVLLAVRRKESSTIVESIRHAKLDFKASDYSGPTTFKAFMLLVTKPSAKR